MTVSYSTLNAWVGSLAAAAIAVQTVGGDGLFELFAVLKVATTLVLLGFWIKMASPGFESKALVGLALFCCAVGDAALLSESGFLWGLLAFLVAHLLLMRVFATESRPVGLNAWVAIPTVLLALWFYTVLFPYTVHLSIPIALYTLVIALMAIWSASLLLARPSPATALICAGAYSFLLSDAALATHRFVDVSLGADHWVLPLYWGALLLMVNGLLRLR